MSGEDFSLMLIFLSILFGFFLFNHLRKLRRIMNILEKVREIVNYNHDDLISHINSIGTSLMISDEHLIKSKEKELSEEILCLFKASQTQFFWEGTDSLSQKNKVIYKLNFNEYYMLYLNSFLNSFENNYKDKDKIYASRNDIDENFYARHLTDYGRVYYKLYLITKAFCESNNKLKHFIGGTPSNKIVEILETNEVQFWKH